MYLTPHLTSAMAMFGFVYLWYLMVVLLLEIWLDYRKQIVEWAQTKPGPMRYVYKMLTLGSYNVSERALRIDHKLARFVTIMGIPSAFLLHGYVGFIFGSVKANPWWSTPMMAIVFLFSAIVSGIALVLLLYMATSWLRKRAIDMRCLDAMAFFLLITFIVDFGLEVLDLIHRIYEADESFKTLDFMVQTKLYTSHIIVQIVLGTLLPIGLLAFVRLVKVSAAARKGVYALSAMLTLIGIFAMRWNVVIGGQLFSKSFLGYTTYKLEFAAREGLLPALLLMLLPFLILWGLIRLLPPFEPGDGASSADA